MTSAKWFGRILLTIAAGLAPQLVAQVQTDVPPTVAGAKPETVEHIKIHGTVLETNLEGDAVDRDVFVFLPPAMRKKSPGAIQSSTLYTATPSAPSNGPMKSMSPIRSKAPSLTARKEMMVVLPDSKTLHNGSMYSSSVTTGDFELFIARDLVAYI